MSDLEQEPKLLMNSGPLHGRALDVPAHLSGLMAVSPLGPIVIEFSDAPNGADVVYTAYPQLDEHGRPDPTAHWQAFYGDTADAPLRPFRLIHSQVTVTDEASTGDGHGLRLMIAILATDLQNKLGEAIAGFPPDLAAQVDMVRAGGNERDPVQCLTQFDEYALLYLPMAALTATS